MTNINVEAFIQDKDINDNDSSEYYTETFLTSNEDHTSDKSGQNIIEALAVESNQHVINTISSNSPKVYDATSLISQCSAEVFCGISIDSAVASFSTVGLHQYEAYQNLFGSTKLNIDQITEVKFGAGNASAIGYSQVGTPIGKIKFHIKQCDTPLLLSLFDIDKIGIIFDNIENMLIYESTGIKHAVIRRFGLTFLMLHLNNVKI